MLIVCPNCTTSYEIAAQTVGAGRSVRCTRCKQVWFATAAELVVASAELESAMAGPSVEDAAAQAAAAAKAMEDEWSAALAAEPVAHSKFATEEEPLASRVTAVPASEAPPLAPADDTAQESAQQPDPHADIETIAARRARIANARRNRRRLSSLTLPLAILVMAAAITLLMVARERVVRSLPQTAGLYATLGLPVNLRGLVFEGVRSADEMHDGVPVMVAEGSIVNISVRTVEVPRLRFAVRNAAGMEIYAWTSLPAQTLLGPGERTPFRSRLASPPGDARDLVVRFFSRRDLEGGR